MNSFFTIPANAAAYGCFYQIAFVGAGLLIFYEGSRRNWPLLPWLIVLMACVIGAIFGSKLFLSWEEIKQFLHAGILPAATNKSYLGGVLGGVAGIYLARRVLGFRHSVLDAFAIALPLAHALGRMGCLLSGCCFGTPTNLPWAVVYEIRTAPHHAHVASGLIASNATASLPIHPTQLYEILFCLALACGLWRMRRFWKAPDSLFQIQILAYVLFRFFIEFLRHGGTMLWGLKHVQWGLLLASVIVTGFIIYKERRSRMQPQQFSAPTHSFRANLFVLASLALIMWMGRNWFTPLEIAVLKFFMIVLCAFVIVHVLQTYARLRLRWAYGGMATVVPLLFIFMQEPASQDTVRSDYATISFGGMAGQYEETCGPTHSYKVGGIGIAGTHYYTRHQSLTYGLRGYFGTDKADNVNGEKFSIRAFNPYVRYDSRYVGLGIGGHAGDLIFDGDTNQSLYPSVVLRAGPYNKFFIEGQLANHFPGGFPAPLIKLGIGIVDRSGTRFRLGISDAGFYFNPYIMTPSGLMIDPFIGFGDAQTYQLGLTLHYRLRK